MLGHVWPPEQSLYLKTWTLTILCLNPFCISLHLSRHQEAQICSLLLFEHSRSVYIVRNWRSVLHRFVHSQNSWHFSISRVSRKCFFLLWIWRKGTRFYKRWWVSFLDILFLVRYNFNDIPSPWKMVVLINKTYSSSIFSILRAIINSYFPFYMTLASLLRNYSFFRFFLFLFTTL